MELNYNMNQILYKNRCQCKELISLTQKRINNSRTEGKPIAYPNNGIIKTFQIKYEEKLSTVAKFLLNSFQNKYIYYAIDDILYSLKSKPIERDNLLAVLYSPILSLQNNFSVNFFDIWIREVYIDEISKNNKFLKTDSPTLKQCNYITIEFYYRIGVPAKKEEPLW